MPPGIDGEWPEIPDVNTPLVTIPNDISEGFSTLWSEIRQRLGVDLMIEMMQPQSCKMDILCLDFPIKEFNGAPLPEWKACLDLAEIAKQEWVFFLRTLLLFIIICNWFVAVFVVLRQW